MMRAALSLLALATVLGCTTTTSDTKPTTAPTADMDTSAAASAAPDTDNAGRPLPLYCEDRRGAEILVTALVVPCVIKSHPLTQLALRDQNDDYAQQRPIGLFERRFDAAMVLRDAAGKNHAFTGNMIGAPSGAGTVYLTSEDGKTTCTAESNLREGTGKGTCSNGQTLAFRFEPQRVRTNGYVIGQQVGGQGLVAFGWGRDASVTVLRAKLQTSG